MSSYTSSAIVIYWYYVYGIFLRDDEALTVKVILSSRLASELDGRVYNDSASTNNRFSCRSTTQVPCSIVRA